jgi:hypothetical protein
MEGEDKTYPPFTLFGLEWTPRAVAYGAWAAWTELPRMTERVDALKAMFADPPWEAFVQAVSVREFDAALIQLWAAVRLPPDLGEA